MAVSERRAYRLFLWFVLVLLYFEYSPVESTTSDVASTYTSTAASTSTSKSASTSGMNGPSVPTADCGGCSRPVHVERVTSDEVRREMLYLERQKIIEQLGYGVPLESEVLFDETFRIGARVARSPPKSDGSRLLQDGNDYEIHSTFVFGQEVQRGTSKTIQCYDETYGKIAGCLDFPLNANLTYDRVDFANLRFFIDTPFITNGNTIQNHVWVVTSMRKRGKSIEKNDANMMSNATADVADELSFVSVDISDQVIDWLAKESVATRRQHQMLTLRITCATCANGARSPVVSRMDRRSFLELGIKYAQPPHRRRRVHEAVTCPNDEQSSAENNGQCCKYPLEVRFADIGMSEFILFPKSYITHYCKGRCQYTASKSYNAVLLKMAQKRMAEGAREEGEGLFPCCAPMETGPVMVVSRLPNGTMDTIFLNDMTVSYCGC